MQIKRHSTAVWNGTGKEGTGSLSSQSGILDNVQYGFKSRFENGAGTNPEELVAAAHAGCFSMKLAFVLNAAGFEATEIHTTCEIVFEDGTVTNSNLILTAKVPEITAEKFAECVKDAEINCPISKLLNAKIAVSHTLNV